MNCSAERNVNMDIMRILALFLVISVHFFLWNDFYGMSMDTAEAFFLSVIRTISMSCVPLFLMLSGALLSGRSLLPVNRNYLKKPGELLLIYFLCTIILIFFRSMILHEPMSLRDMIVNLFSFSQYSWYVFMYVGLFILIPYFNFIWNKLNDRWDKIILIVILCVLTTLTSILNIRQTILPEIWSGIYPVSYYFLGAYISKEYEKIKIKKNVIFMVWVISAFIFSAFNFIISRKDRYAMGAWNDWGSYENIILSLLVFVFILKLDTGNMKTRWRKILKVVSGWTYVAFMLSYISDIIAWKVFKDIIPVSNKLLIYIPSVFISFGMAMIMSWIFNIVYGKLKGLLLWKKRYF